MSVRGILAFAPLGLRMIPPPPSQASFEAARRVERALRYAEDPNAVRLWLSAPWTPEEEELWIRSEDGTTFAEFLVFERATHHYSEDPSRTGTLRRSISYRIEDSGDMLRGVVGTNVRYAREASSYTAVRR